MLRLSHGSRTTPQYPDGSAPVHRPSSVVSHASRCGHRERTTARPAALIACGPSPVLVYVGQWRSSRFGGALFGPSSTSSGPPACAASPCNRSPSRWSPRTRNVDLQLLVNQPTEQLEHPDEVALSRAIGSDEDIQRTQVDRSIDNGGEPQHLEPLETACLHADSVRPPVHTACERVTQASGGVQRSVRSIPAARPLPAMTRAIFRLASSIISSPIMAEPLSPPASEVEYP